MFSVVVARVEPEILALRFIAHTLHTKSMGLTYSYLRMVAVD